MRLPATIVAIRQETPTIKSFALDLHGREIGFMAGQWVSIVRSAHELGTRTRLTLVYSASTPDELLFKSELASIAATNPRISPVFTVTQPSPETWGGHTGRIDADLLRAESIDLDALFFVCGPPSMIRAMVSMLRSLGVPRPRIRYEQWW